MTTSSELDERPLLRFVRTRLLAAGDARRAQAMAAYMKTNMPFYGVQKPGRVTIERALAERFPVTSRASYHAAVAALWREPHREAKYLAIAVARRHASYVTIGSVPRYERMIREGAWWDFVDEIATRLIGRVLLDDRARMSAKLDRWIDADDLWIRRTAIIAQLTHKVETDESRLFDYCRRRMHEREFFIRKAIGWALREHAKTNAAAVRRFLRTHRDELSSLSYREASKHL